MESKSDEDLPGRVGGRAAARFNRTGHQSQKLAVDFFARVVLIEFGVWGNYR
jgi:hypothetical protein